MNVKTLYGFIVVALVRCWLLGLGNGVTLFLGSEPNFVYSFALALACRFFVHLVQFSNYSFLFLKYIFCTIVSFIFAGPGMRD